MVTATNGIAITVTRFTYDGDGQRVQRVNGDGSKTAYLGNLMEVELAVELGADSFLLDEKSIDLRFASKALYLRRRRKDRCEILPAVP